MTGPEICVVGGMMRLQKLFFAVAGVRGQEPGVSKNRELWRWLIGELSWFRLFAVTSGMPSGNILHNVLLVLKRTLSYLEIMGRRG